MSQSFSLPSGKKIAVSGPTHELTFGKWITRIIKRVFDILAAAIGLFLLAPFFAIIALLIRNDSPGPVFFWCRRMGKDGRPFRMLKFRTMYELPSSYQGPPVTCKDDGRITPLGHWLRDTKINELPQLWNVLIGEMSLVGPRPEDVGIAEDWPAEAFTEILSVKPGITSPASILYHAEEDLLSRANVMRDYLKEILPDKMRLDRLYVRNQTFPADLDIILWTLVIFVPRISRGKIPEGYIFAGPISRLIHRYVSWFLVDLLVSFSVVGISGVLWRSQEPLNWGIDNLAILAAILALIFSGLNSLGGLNRVVWSRATVEDALGLAVSCGLATLLILGLNYGQMLYGWFPYPPLPTTMLFTIGILSLMSFTAVRYRLRLITSLAGYWLRWRQNRLGVQERVLIIGAGDGCHIANWLLKREEFNFAFKVVGLVDDDIPTQRGMYIEGCKVLGKVSELPALIEKYDVGVILFTTHLIPAEVKDFVFGLCLNSSLRLAFIKNLIADFSQQLAQSVSRADYPLWAEDPLRFQALHDTTTGLPNRFLFQDRLLHSVAYAKRYETNPVVIFISLDEPSLTDGAADGKCRTQMLQEAARRLLRIKRESDTLAYLEKNEFAMILENIPDEQTVCLVAERIFSLTAEPFRLQGKNYRVEANISAWSGAQDCDCSEILKSPLPEFSQTNRRQITIGGQIHHELVR